VEIHSFNTEFNSENKAYFAHFLHASNKLCAKDKQKNVLGESGFHEKRRSKATLDIGDSMNLCPYFPHFYDWRIISVLTSLLVMQFMIYGFHEN